MERLGNSAKIQCQEVEKLDSHGSDSKSSILNHYAVSIPSCLNIYSVHTYLKYSVAAMWNNVSTRIIENFKSSWQVLESEARLHINQNWMEIIKSTESYIMWKFW